MAVNPRRQRQLHEIGTALRCRGMRMTRPRQRVINVLLDATQPLAAEQIRVRSGLGASDLVTVYRNLDMLLGLGMVQRILLENGTQLFEWAADSHHHHLVCRQCHRTVQLAFCAGELLEKAARNAGYTDISHVMEVFGLCPACSKRP
jgi:Fe2+ or Zn2+ uptake regulation protein